MTSTPGASVRRTGSNARALLLLVISITCPSALCQVLQHSKISLPGAALETREEALKLKGPHRPPEILVLAPDDDMFPYSLHKVVPAVMVAVDYLQHSRNLTLVVNYNNTNCSSSHGPLLAFDHYIAGKVDVFLGPTCSYVLAPVARYSAEWDLPVLTSSGQNDNFDMKHPNYRLLTRMNGSFTQVGQLFIETLRRFGWQVVAFLFHEFRERTKGHSDCFFNLAAVFNALGGGHMFHQKFDEEDPSLDLETLMQQVARNARSWPQFRPIGAAADPISLIDSANFRGRPTADAAGRRLTRVWGRPWRAYRIPGHSHAFRS
ncbi:hypothetical protein HPB49_021431 [Dermacentor silvarum]|uniref:Uncharacterized protein n=1 Tax=Dermacentor silvarum TaxID=543639 RepID=A0ACB8CMQ1_DERSI|nr:hypothetical protein HPB49_021431 [Dermacentor silvarum]